MNTTLAFDVYGTLIDTGGVSVALEAHVGEQAPTFARLWRDKQLEYAFRRGLMGRYRPFPVCTCQALDYACAAFGLELAQADHDALMAAYRELPPFADVVPAMSDLAREGHPLYAFSNGLEEDVRGLLARAGIEPYFDGVISVDDVESFKPDPKVYHHFLRSAGVAASDSWLVSSNPFDVMGAIAVGMRSAWVRRGAAAIFDPWELEPTVTVSDLKDLAAAIASMG